MSNNFDNYSQNVNFMSENQEMAKEIQYLHNKLYYYPMYAKVLINLPSFHYQSVATTADILFPLINDN